MCCLYSVKHANNRIRARYNASNSIRLAQKLVLFVKAYSAVYAQKMQHFFSLKAQFSGSKKRRINRAYFDGCPAFCPSLIGGIMKMSELKLKNGERTEETKCYRHLEPALSGFTVVALMFCVFFSIKSLNQAIKLFYSLTPFQRLNTAA